MEDLRQDYRRFYLKPAETLSGLVVYDSEAIFSILVNSVDAKAADETMRRYCERNGYLWCDETGDPHTY